MSKHLCYSFCYLLFALNTPAQYKPDNYPVEKVTQEEFTQLLEACSDQNYGLARRRILILDAIKSKRQDLVAACFGFSSATHEIVRQAATLPDDEQRTLAVITMLRSEGGFWPDDNEDTLPMGRSPMMLTERYLLVEPFTSTVKTLLPDVKLSIEIMRYKASRAKLAGELEKAFQARRGSTRPSPPAALSPTAANNPPPVPQLSPDPTRKAEPPASRVSGATVEEPCTNTSTYWLAGLVAALALLVWRLVARPAKK